MLQRHSTVEPTFCTAEAVMRAHQFMRSGMADVLDFVHIAEVVEGAICALTRNFDPTLIRQ
jgi:hypothetical protein